MAQAKMKGGDTSSEQDKSVDTTTSTQSAAPEKEKFGESALDNELSIIRR